MFPSTCRPLQVDGHFWCGIRKPVDLHSLTAIFGPAVMYLPNLSQPVDLYSLTTIFGSTKKCQKPWRRLQVDGQLASHFYCFSQPVDLCRLTDNFKQERATHYCEDEIMQHYHTKGSKYKSCNHNLGYPNYSTLLHCKITTTRLRSKVFSLV